MNWWRFLPQLHLNTAPGLCLNQAEQSWSGWQVIYKSCAISYSVISLFTGFTSFLNFIMNINKLQFYPIWKEKAKWDSCLAHPTALSSMPSPRVGWLWPVSQTSKILLFKTQSCLTIFFLKLTQLFIPFLVIPLRNSLSRVWFERFGQTILLVCFTWLPVRENLRKPSVTLLVPALLVENFHIPPPSPTLRGIVQSWAVLLATSCLFYPWSYPQCDCSCPSFPDEVWLLYANAS